MLDIVDEKNKSAETVTIQFCNKEQAQFAEAVVRDLKDLVIRQRIFESTMVISDALKWLLILGLLWKVMYGHA